MSLRFKYKNNNVSADISLARQAENIKKAQFMLDTQIMNDMIPLRRDIFETICKMRISYIPFLLYQ